MNSWEQLFDFNGGPELDTPTTQSPAAGFCQTENPGMISATAFRGINDRPNDLGWFDIPPNEHQTSSKPQSLPSPPDTTVKPSNIETSGGGRSQAISDHGARHELGQITPPDDTPKPLPYLPSDNNSTLPQMNYDGTKDTPSPETASIDEQRTVAEVHLEPSEQIPKKRKRGRKAKNPPKELQNPEDELKREKFLERNRVAASKCRERKREWMNGLEDRARTLQTERNHLSAYAGSLREELLYLRNEMLKHQGCGCTKIRKYLNGQVEKMNPSANLHHLMTDVASLSNTLLTDIGQTESSKTGNDSTAFDSPTSAMTDQDSHSSMESAMPKSGQRFC